jgi:hypothetical protein
VKKQKDTPMPPIVVSVLKNSKSLLQVEFLPLGLVVILMNVSKLETKVVTKSWLVGTGAKVLKMKKFACPA